MRFFRRLLKMMGWLFLAVSGLFAVVFIALIVANWQDDPLSEATQQLLHYTPPTEADLQGNGYLILMGLDAPAQNDAIADAIALGRQRLTREIERRRWVEEHGDATEGMPPFITTKDVVVSNLSKTLRCPPDQTDCFGWYEQRRAEVETSLQKDQVLLQRLKAIAHAEQFNDPTPAYLLWWTPRFDLLVHGHESWLAQASLLWMEGQPQQALMVAQEALELRKRLAYRSNNLLASMIALAMQYRELRWFRDANAHLSPQMSVEIAQRIENMLQTPPASLHESLEGEKRFVASILYSLGQTKHAPTPLSPLDEFPAWWKHLLDLAYLPQQTLNLFVDRVSQMQTISDLSPHQQEATFAGARHRREEEPCSYLNFWKLRNVVGFCMLGFSPDYQEYFQHVADMEGYRRLVLLQHRAIMQQMTLADMPDWLAKTPSELHNPYTLQPMQWDADSGSLVFEGHGKQSQHSDGKPLYRIVVK